MHFSSNTVFFQFIKSFGPLASYRVNLYESKFSKVKSNCSFNKNKINVSSSIAKSSEYVRSVEFLEKKHRRDVYEVPRFIQMALEKMDNGRELSGNICLLGD